MMSQTLQASALQIRTIKSPEIYSPLASFAKVEEDAPTAKRKSVFVMSRSIRSFQSFL